MMDDEELDRTQDNSGRLAAGTVVAWAKEAEKDLTALSTADFREYMEWVRQSQPYYSAPSKPAFAKIVDWIQDGEYAADAYEYYVAVQERDETADPD